MDRLEFVFLALTIVNYGFVVNAFHLGLNFEQVHRPFLDHPSDALKDTLLMANAPQDLDGTLFLATLRKDSIEKLDQLNDLEATGQPKTKTPEAGNVRSKRLLLPMMYHDFIESLSHELMDQHHVPVDPHHDVHYPHHDVHNPHHGVHNPHHGVHENPHHLVHRREASPHLGGLHVDIHDRYPHGGHHYGGHHLGGGHHYGGYNYGGYHAGSHHHGHYDHYDHHAGHYPHGHMHRREALHAPALAKQTKEALALTKPQD
ncbi:histidine-rich glycoprotein-like [Cloeon dipterum]|uniref:histidine-rich glycoprotein-like n=1 Tax=Cloeon dipterum TaxID=197152 RepID=UPI003220592A